MSYYSDPWYNRDPYASIIAGLLIIVLIAVPIALLTFCTNQGRNDLKHWQSSFGGLKRKVTLYDANGKPLKSWTTTSKVEDKGGSYFFIDDNDKAQRVSGTVIIEEL